MAQTRHMFVDRGASLSKRPHLKNSASSAPGPNREAHGQGKVIFKRNARDASSKCKNRHDVTVEKRGVPGTAAAATATATIYRGGICYK